MFTVGQRVKVVKDHEAAANDQPSEWVGAIGKFVAVRDLTCIIAVIANNPNPEDGVMAWFDESELAPAVQDESGNWLAVGEQVRLVHGGSDGGYLYEGKITAISETGILDLDCDEGDHVTLRASVIHLA
jgi:hypothetical protein